MIYIYNSHILKMPKEHTKISAFCGTPKSKQKDQYPWGCLMCM